MKYRGSKPSTESNAARRNKRHEPDSHPATRSATSVSDCLYALVHGFAGHTRPTTACPIPLPSEGSSRADGYVDPSTFLINGPNAPPRGHRDAASSNVSMEPSPHSMSGLATMIQPYSGPSAATPRLAPAPYPRLPPVRSSSTFSRPAAASGAPSVEPLSAMITRTG